MKPFVNPVERSLPARDFLFGTVPWLLLAVTALPFIALVVWLGFAYFGIEYSAPPWDVHSVPPPRLY